MASENPILNALNRMEERLLTRIDERFRDLNVDLDGRFDAVHQRLDRLEQEYEMLKAGLARLEADVATLKADVAGLKVDVAQLKVDVATLKRDVADLKVLVGRLDQQAEREERAREDLKAQAVEFRRRLGALETRVDEIEERLPRD